MKQFSLVLNITLLLLVAVLYYLHFNSEKMRASPAEPKRSEAQASPVSSNTNTTIAYFEMDSLQANYSYFKDALNQLKAKEQGMNAELSGLERAYQKKVSEWQKRGASMSQAEADAAQKENAEMQQNYQVRKQILEESFAKQSMEFKKDIKKKIEAYLREFNKDKHYTYILSYEPDFIFYRDSTYNITPYLISGLNSSYQKKK